MKNGLSEIVFCFGLTATAATSLLNEAVDALRRGDNVTAERKLRTELQTHPDGTEALSFLGVALDNQKRFQEAETHHRRALVLAPDSNSVLDKYAAHQLAMGDESGARKTLAHALEMIPNDGYANLQLAILALKAKDGPEALVYLNRLSPTQQQAPDVAIDRLMALELIGNHTEAVKLGTEILKPQNPDTLYSLAYAWDSLGQPVETLRVLARAVQLAPHRQDIQKSFATSAANLGEYRDALAGWEKYVSLNPADDAGRRERGFAAIHVNKRESGLADLRWYTSRHADDAEGWYELGIAENSIDPTTGVSSFDKALALKPDFTPALSSRGALHYRDGRPEAALPDLERAVKIDPSSAMNQYRLGQVYQALDRLNDAIAHYRRAAELAPNDYQAQFHLANALAEAGQTAESDVLLERIRTWPVRSSFTAKDLIETK